MFYILIILAIIIVAIVLIEGKNKSPKGASSSPKSERASTRKTYSKEYFIEKGINTTAHKDRKRKEEQHYMPNYWQEFKRQRPLEALEIERITVRDMDFLSDKDAFEVVSSLKRWSRNVDVPIKDLKKWFLESFEIQVREVGLDYALSKLKDKKREEAQKLNLSEENTVCALMEEFLNNSDFLNNHSNDNFELHQREHYGFDDKKKKKKEFRDMVMALLKTLIPNDDKDRLDQNLAWLISSEMLDMIRNGNIKDYPLNKEIIILLKIAIKKKDSLDLSDEEFDKLFDGIQEDFLHSF